MYPSLRNIAVAHRGSLINFGLLVARRGSITFSPSGGEEGGCGGGANMWRLQVVFVRTFRAFLEYILPAGGSSAINITRGSNRPTSDEGG